MQPKITFAKGNPYAFFFEDAHLLLVEWQRDNKKELYHIVSQTDDQLVLDYPGDLFVEQVMHVIEHIFFIAVQEEKQTVNYALGAYFLIGEKAYGVYYQRNRTEEPPELFFFQVVEEGEGYGLQVVDDEQEHEKVTKAFMDHYAEWFRFH